MKETQKKILIVFSSSYPYGERETYLDLELEYLSKGNFEIHLVPLYNPYKKKKRELAKQINVHPVLLPQGFLNRIKIILFKRIVNKDMLLDFFRFKVFLSKKKMIRWVNGYSLFIQGSNFYNNFRIQHKDYQCICYSYWAESTFLVNKIFDETFRVIRMHGADFYLNRNQGYLPLRSIMYDKANLLLPISKDIQSILIDDYMVNPNKVRLSYLGVKNNLKLKEEMSISTTILKFVSCSHVYPLKRVKEIFNFVKEFTCSYEVEWYHYGGGSDFEELFEYVKNNDRKNLKVYLKGHVSSKKLEEEYIKNKFDWFVNLSKHEGLPVSIMEAFSYGVPAIATNVGGTKEIVNTTNGFIINSIESLEEVREIIINQKREEYIKMKEMAYATWQRNFNSDVNYKNLVKYFEEI